MRRWYRGLGWLVRKHRVDLREDRAFLERRPSQLQTENTRLSLNSARRRTSERVPAWDGTERRYSAVNCQFSLWADPARAISMAHGVPIFVGIVLFAEG